MDLVNSYLKVGAYAICGFVIQIGNYFYMHKSWLASTQFLSHLKAFFVGRTFMLALQNAMIFAIIKFCLVFWTESLIRHWLVIIIAGAWFVRRWLLFTNGWRWWHTSWPETDWELFSGSGWCCSWTSQFSWRQWRKSSCELSHCLPVKLLFWWCAVAGCKQFWRSEIFQSIYIISIIINYLACALSLLLL